jgi:hypothetical protein
MKGNTYVALISGMLTVVAVSIADSMRSNKSMMRTITPSCTEQCIATHLWAQIVMETGDMCACVYSAILRVEDKQCACMNSQ